MAFWALYSRAMTTGAMSHRMQAGPGRLIGADAPPQTLMIDADDTLWENNIYFERAITAFVEMIDHPTLHANEVRAAFDRLEHTRVRVHGYGAGSFRASMQASFRELLARQPSAAEQERIGALAEVILTAEIELLDGVSETLPLLAARHRLILVTKGDLREQTGKLSRSGLAPLFHHVEVLREKHTEAYLQLRDQHGCDARSTWMIGNSPRSDINPAIAAGLHAIFIPHSSTWVLEDESLAAPRAHQHLLRLSTFRDLISVL